MDRSPYGEDRLELLSDMYLPFGFIIVGQDMRGTGKSEGNFTMWHSDGDDAEDTGNWIASQNWSNGKIFTFGVSADGLAAFRTPDHQPPWLKAQYFALATASGYDTIFPNGAYLQGLANMWIHTTVPEQADDCLAIVAENEMKTEWWDALELTNNYYKIDFPASFWGGWYDIFLVGSLAAYDGYNFQSNPSIQHHAKITIDPAGHCQDAKDYFKQDSLDGRTALVFAQSLEVFGVFPVIRPNIKNITFYVMSSNDKAGLATGQYWSSIEKWPVPKMEKWYLHADKTLSTTVPTEGSSATSYVHDPANPLPTVGGNNLILTCGPQDQNEIDLRDDVITFDSKPFSTDYPMTGPLFATLFVSSDAIDTDFMVRISDIYPTGQVRLIQDNAIRMRWRDGGLEPHYMKKGEIYEVTMTLWNTSYILATGHALRVSISSSNYPRFDVNRNNGILLADRNSMDVNVTATNMIYHSEKYPSYISLPYVTKNQIPVTHDIKGEIQKAYPQIDMEKIIKDFPKLLENRFSRH
jgi:putative CocE/NonD family hydrolase